MRARMLALAAGMLLLVTLPALPSTLLLVLIAACALLALRVKAVALACCLAGFVWACVSAQWALDDRLDPALDGRTLWLEGRVVELPEQSAEATRFYLVGATSRRGALPNKIRLSWYGAPPIHTGERWRLAVKLKSPEGNINPQAFDYSAWLLAQRVGATGSVKAGTRLSASAPVLDWRDRLREKMQRVPAAGREASVIALVLGDGAGLSLRDWQVLRDTGTVHLMVISGQHISLLALLVYALVKGLARLGLWPKAWPWLPWACALAFGAALGYGLLAGFNVPVQRALLMVALVLLWRLRFEQLGVLMPVLMALVAVLAFEPLVVLQPGFWLSFIAVGALLWVFAKRLGKWGFLHTWWRAQWAMSLALLPALIALGLPVSFTAPLANLVAVPWISVISVPLALLGTLLLPVPWLGESLLWLAGVSLDALFGFLSFLADTWPAWLPSHVAPWRWLLAALGVLIALAPHGVPFKALGLSLMLPMLFPPSGAPKVGMAKVWVLDVGQGLSVLVRTHQHALLYDAGPKMGEFDTGERIIAPSLAALNVRRLDQLLISHADQDHAGGAQAISQAMPVMEVVSGEAHKLARLNAQACVHGKAWQWDQVRFSTWQFLHAQNANQASCVLMVEANGERLLLTGDIDSRAERWLEQQVPSLAARFLVVAHHGSRSSSSASFINAVKPEAALISRGKHNSFNHPHPWVLERFAKAKVKVYDTAQSGALKLELGAWQGLEMQKQQAKFWR